MKEDMGINFEYWASRYWYWEYSWDRVPRRQRASCLIVSVRDSWVCVCGGSVAGRADATCNVWHNTWYDIWREEIHSYNRVRRHVWTDRLIWNMFVRLPITDISGLDWKSEMAGRFSKWREQIQTNTPLTLERGRRSHLPTTSSQRWSESLL